MVSSKMIFEIAIPTPRISFANYTTRLLWMSGFFILTILIPPQERHKLRVLL